MTDQHSTRVESALHARIAILTLAIALPLIGIQWMSERPPAVQNEGSGFLAGAAMKDLRYLLSDGYPHPTGTFRNAAVKARLEALLRGLGYVPEEQNTYQCSEAGVCAEVENVLVRIPGVEQSGGVLLDAHYDSVAASPGAADNGSGVAIAIEAARLFRRSERPKHPVFLLFDDGEEQQLLGAQAFVEENPAARAVKWIVNLDARGVTGPSMMFETSDRNAGLISFFARKSVRPVANSLMFDLYRRLPSNTNFTIFRANGWSGFNLAFLGKTQFYHRTGDAVSNTDARSVQHQGEEAWSLLRALADAPPEHTSTDNAVYFDLFSHLCWWPSRWSGYATAVSAVLLIVGCMLHRQLLSPGRVALSTTIMPLTLAATGVVAFAALSLAFPGTLAPMYFVAHPAPFACAFSALGVAVAVALYRTFYRRISLVHYYAGQCILWTICAALSSVFLTGGSYLFVLPALSMAISLFWVGARHSIGGNSVLLPSTLITGVLWVPLLRILYNAGGLVTFPLMAIVAAILLLLLLPLSGSGQRWLYPAALAALLLSAVSGAAAMSLPLYTKQSPLPLNISYVQVASGGSYWVTACRQRNLWRIQRLVDEMGFRVLESPNTLIPWADKQIPLLKAPAPHVAVGSPELKILSKSINHGEVTVDAQMQAAPGTDRSVLYMAPEVRLRSMAVNGKPIPVDPANHWRKYETTTARDKPGIGVTFTYDSAGSDEMYIVDLRYGLPREGASLLKARPQEAMASQDGDTTIVVRRAPL